MYDASKSRWAKGQRAYGDAPLVEGQRILIYGDFGSGKTTFAGTAPKPVFLDSDYGENKSLRMAQHPYFIIDGDQPFAKVNTFLDDMLGKRDVFDPDGGPLADRLSLCIDSWTKLNELLLWEIAQTATKPVDLTRERPSIDMYGTLKLRQQSLVRKIKDLCVKRGINVVVTALAVMEGDETEKLQRDSKDAMLKTGYDRVKGSPAMVGAFRKLIGAEFKETYFLDVMQGARPVRRIHTCAFENYAAKTQLGLPAYVDDPTFDKIVALAQAK